MSNEELINKLIADRLRGGQPVETVPNVQLPKAPKVIDPRITTGKPDTPVTQPSAQPSNKNFYFLHETVPEGVETEIKTIDVNGSPRKVRAVKGVVSEANVVPGKVGAGQAIGDLEQYKSDIKDVDWGDTLTQVDVGAAEIERGALATKEATFGKLGKEDQARFDELTKFVQENRVRTDSDLWMSMFDPLAEDGVLGAFETINNVAKGVTASLASSVPHMLASGAGGLAGGAAGSFVPGVGSAAGGVAGLWSTSSSLYTAYNLASQKEKLDKEGGDFNVLGAAGAGVVSGGLDVATVGLLRKTPFLGKYVDYLVPGANTVAKETTKEVSKSITKRAADYLAITGGIALGAGAIEGAQEFADYYGGDNNSTILGTLTSNEAWRNAGDAALWGATIGFLGGGIGSAVDIGLKARKGKEPEKLVEEAGTEANVNQDNLYGEYETGDTTGGPLQGSIEELLVRASRDKNVVKDFENIYKDAKSDANRLDTKGVKIYNLRDKEALYNKPEFLEDLYKDLDEASRKEIPDTDSIFGNSPNVINDTNSIIFDERVDDIFNSVLSTNDRFKAAVEKDPSKKVQLFQQVAKGIQETRRKAEAAIKAVKDPQSPIRTKILEAYESSQNNPIRRRLVSDLAKKLPMIDKNPLVGHLMSDQTLLDMKAAIDSGKYKERLLQNKQQRLDSLETGILAADNDQKALSGVFKNYVDENYRPSNPLKVFDDIADAAVRAAARPKQAYNGVLKDDSGKIIRDLTSTSDPVTGLPINTATRLITNRILESNEYLKEIAGDAGVDYIRNRVISNLKAIKKDFRKGGPQVDVNRPIGEGIVPGGFEGIWDKDLDTWLDSQIRNNDGPILGDDPLSKVDDGSVKPVTLNNPNPRVDTVGLGKLYAVLPEDGVPTDRIEASDDYGRFESGNKPSAIREVNFDDLEDVRDLDEEIDVVEFFNNWPGTKPDLGQLDQLNKGLFKAPLKTRSASAKDLLDFAERLSPENAELVKAFYSQGDYTFTDKATGERTVVFNTQTNKNLGKFKDSVFPVDFQTATALKNVQSVTNKAGAMIPGSGSVWSAPELRATERFDPSKDLTPSKGSSAFQIKGRGRSLKLRFKNPQVESITKQSYPVFNSFIRSILGKKGFSRVSYLPVAESENSLGFYDNSGALVVSFLELTRKLETGNNLSWKDFRDGPLRTLFHEIFHAADFLNVIPEKDRQIILDKKKEIIDWGKKNNIVIYNSSDIEYPAYVFMEYALQRIEKGLVKNGKLALDKDSVNLEDLWNEIDKAWKNGATSPVANIPSPTLRKIFEGIYEGVVQFRNWLTGKGVTTWTDVFDNLLSGEYAKQYDRSNIPFTGYPANKNIKGGRGPTITPQVSEQEFVQQALENDSIKQTEQTTLDSIEKFAQLKALDNLIKNLEDSDIKKSLEKFSTRMKRLLNKADRGGLTLSKEGPKSWFLSNLASSTYLADIVNSIEMLGRRDPDAAAIGEFAKSMENLPREILHALNPIASNLKQKPWFPKSFSMALDLRKRNVSLKDVNPDGTLSFKDPNGKTITLPRQEVERLKTVTTTFSIPLTMYAELAWNALGVFKGQHPELQEALASKNVAQLKQVVADLIQANKEFPDGTKLSNAEIKTVRDLTNQIVEYEKHVIGGRIYVPEMRFGNRAVAVYSTRPADRNEEANQMDPDLRLKDDEPPKKVLVGLFMSEPEGVFEREMNPERMKEREKKIRDDVLKKYNPKDGYEITEFFDMTNDAFGKSIRASDVDISMVASMMSNKLAKLFDGDVDLDPTKLKDLVQNYITRQGFGKHLIRSRHIDGASTDANRVIDAFFNSTSYGVSRAAHGPLLTKVSADLIEKINTDPVNKGKFQTLLNHLSYSTSTDGDYANFRTFGFLYALGLNPSSAILQFQSNVVMAPMLLARYGIMDPLTGLSNLRPAMKYLVRVAAEDAKAFNEGRKNYKTKGGLDIVDPAFEDSTLDPFLNRFVKDQKQREYIKKSLQDNSIAVSPSIVDEGRTAVTSKSRAARVWDNSLRAMGYMLQRSEQSGRVALYTTVLKSLYNRPAKIATIIADLNEVPKFKELRVNNKNLDDANAIASFIAGEAFAYSNKVSRPGYNRKLFSFFTPFTSMPGQIFETWFDVVIGQGKGKLTDKVIASAFGVLMPLALSGAAGYPFYELITTLIERLGDSDAPGELQLMKFIGDYTGSPKLGEVAVRGGLRSVLGVDIAQRLATQPGYQDIAMLGFGLAFGKAPELRDIGIVGATLNSGLAFNQALQNGGLTAEKTALALEAALPAGLRNPIAAGRYLNERASDGVIRNAKGTPVLPASELEVSDIFAKLMGFQPVEIQNANIVQYGKNLSSRVNEKAKTAILDELAAIDRKKLKGLSFDNAKREALISEYYRLSNGRTKASIAALGKGVQTRLRAAQNPNDPKVLTPGQEGFLSTFKDYIKISE